MFKLTSKVELSQILYTGKYRDQHIFTVFKSTPVWNIAFAPVLNIFFGRPLHVHFYSEKLILNSTE